ncbi:MAG: hypothetical protein ACK5TI_00265, partial [bacterium]
VHGSKAIAGDDGSDACAHDMKRNNTNYTERFRRLRLPAVALRTTIQNRCASSMTCSDVA